jgi:hypothetical protein
LPSTRLTRTGRFFGGLRALREIFRPMNPKTAIDFIERHGIVLERAKGKIPNLVDAIVGAPVRGSWWAHPEARRIYEILGAVHDSPDVLRCRLVDAKVTYAHRRVWPAIVRLAERIGTKRLDRQKQEHTASGAHRTVTTPFPEWVPPLVIAGGEALSWEAALAIVAPFAP